MPLNLLKRNEKGAPLDVNDHDTNLTAIEDAITSVESDIADLQAAGGGGNAFGGTEVVLTTSPASNTQDVTGVSFIRCTGDVTLYRLTGGVQGQQLFIFAEGIGVDVTLARFPRQGTDNIYVDGGDTQSFTFDTGVTLIFYLNKWLAQNPAHTYTF